jgi:hypothetical protein
MPCGASSASRAWHPTAGPALPRTLGVANRSSATKSGLRPASRSFRSSEEQVQERAERADRKSDQDPRQRAQPASLAVAPDPNKDQDEGDGQIEQDLDACPTLQLKKEDVHIAVVQQRDDSDGTEENKNQEEESSLHARSLPPRRTELNDVAGHQRNASGRSDA